MRKQKLADSFLHAQFQRDATEVMLKKKIKLIVFERIKKKFASAEL